MVQLDLVEAEPEAERARELQRRLVELDDAVGRREPHAALLHEQRDRRRDGEAAARRAADEHAAAEVQGLGRERQAHAELAADVVLARRLLVRDVEAAVDEVLGVLVRKDRADLRASCVHRGRDDG